MNPFGWIYTRLGNLQPPATPDVRLRVTNLTRHSLLATQLEVADSAPKRSKGLLGRERLAPGEGLWIVPCEAVHTFAMKFPIDLVYLDRNHRVRKIKNAVPPWRMSACLSAHSILELPAGVIRGTQTQRGDMLEFSPAEFVF
ncbi:MAG: DUF192 domain-containing protein [Terracidiphilus sp.]|nr:DUF192 domain-containing protein [Terracidiphilus sp.]